MLVYFNRTEACVQFHADLIANQVNSNYLIGKDTSAKRKKIRYQLEHNTLSVLCLCGCYNEGVSIDTIQTVVFGELRHSSINKIQISMRANRKHHTKPHYRIVLPITHDDVVGKGHSRTGPILRTHRPQSARRVPQQEESSRVQVCVGQDRHATEDTAEH